MRSAGDPETIGYRMTNRARANGNIVISLSMASKEFDFFLDEIRYELVNYKTTKKFMGWLELKLELTEIQKEKFRYQKQVRDEEKEKQ